MSTATIQGTVSDDTGVLPGATITAREAQSGFTHETVSAGDGTFTPGRAEAGAVRDHGETYEPAYNQVGTVTDPLTHTTTFLPTTTWGE